MSALYIRGSDGKFVLIPSIPGKSAYEIAVEKGVFSGTEEEFARAQVFPNKEVLDQITQEKIEAWDNGGSADIHVGTEPPEDTTYIWIDTSAPYNFEVSTHDGRLRLKYIEMLELTKTKLLNIQKDIEVIEKNIEKVTGSEGTDFRIGISRIKSQITIIQNGIASTIQSILSGGDLTNLKITSKNLRRNTKTLSYDLSDINTNVLRVIDGQNQIEDNGGTNKPDIPDNPITPDTTGAILITEDGKQILTEDGLLILLDGVEIESDTIPTNAILAESGLVILTEDGLVILADGMSDATLTDAILTEQGLFILTEDGKYILKN